MIYENIIDVDYTYYPGTPGRTYGPPEHCFPEEPPELEINAIYVEGYQIYPVMDEKFLEHLTKHCVHDAHMIIQEKENDRAEALYDAWKDDQYAY